MHKKTKNPTVLAAEVGASLIPHYDESGKLVLMRKETAIPCDIQELFDRIIQQEADIFSIDKEEAGLRIRKIIENPNCDAEEPEIDVFIRIAKIQREQIQKKLEEFSVLKQARKERAQSQTSTIQPSKTPEELQLEQMQKDFANPNFSTNGKEVFIKASVKFQTKREIEQRFKNYSEILDKLFPENKAHSFLTSIPKQDGGIGECKLRMTVDEYDFVKEALAMDKAEALEMLGLNEPKAAIAIAPNI